EVARLQRGDAFELAHLLAHVLVLVRAKPLDLLEDERTEERIFEERSILGNAPTRRRETGEDGARHAAKADAHREVFKAERKDAERAIDDLADTFKLPIWMNAAL